MRKGIGKVEKQLVKKYIYFAEMRNKKKEKEEGMMEGKYFFVEEKK